MIRVNFNFAGLQGVEILSDDPMEQDIELVGWQAIRSRVYEIDAILKGITAGVISESGERRRDGAL
jgi:hypothetical protein